MSWRQILGLDISAEGPFTHNSQNTQKAENRRYCADIADFARRDPEQDDSRLLEDLAEACKGLDLQPSEVKAALAPEDITDWLKGRVTTETLTALARSLVQRRDMDQGKRPDHYTERASCEHCGPVWLWTPGEVLGCPWCWNRVADKPIPRPCAVRCSDCRHFTRTAHPHIGHCSKGMPEPVCGLWDMDSRYCDRYLPSDPGLRGKREASNKVSK
tara:strand:+ start:5678 stop:6322 length:645 start_codon:yes stop_codon:yes gene_type:complete